LVSQCELSQRQQIAGVVVRAFALLAIGHSRVNAFSPKKPLAALSDARNRVADKSTRPDEFLGA
jgi:hypothetical protein